MDLIRHSRALFVSFLIAATLAWLPALSSAAETESDDALDNEIAALKAEVAALNSTLFELEEEVLSPANTQVAIYLSFAAGEYLILDSLEISVDGQPAVSHLYTGQERRALDKGGVQRLYLGNLSAGEHRISAVVNGQGGNDRDYRQDARFTIHKPAGKAQYELVVDAEAPSFEPTLRLEEWQ